MIAQNIVLAVVQDQTMSLLVDCYILWDASIKSRFTVHYQVNKCYIQQYLSIFLK